MEKAVFLDRDGVINEERGDYTYRVEDFIIIDGVKQALESLKQNNFLTIIITNQAGISRGIYSREDMQACHNYMTENLPGLIDDIFFSPYHPSITESLSRKPGSLMFERAMARYDITSKGSWMVGDKERDLVPAKQLGLKTVIVDGNESGFADHHAKSLLDASMRFLTD